MNSKANIAQNIRTIARTRRITFVDLCAAIDMSEAVFYKRLKNESKWDIDELDAIALQLDVPAPMLLASGGDVHRYLAEQVEQMSPCLTEVAA